MFYSEKGKLQHRPDVLHLKTGKHFCPENTASHRICQSPTALASPSDRVLAFIWCNVLLARRLSSPTPSWRYSSGLRPTKSPNPPAACLKSCVLSAQFHACWQSSTNPHKTWSGGFYCALNQSKSRGFSRRHEELTRQLKLLNGVHWTYGVASRLPSVVFLVIKNRTVLDQRHLDPVRIESSTITSRETQTSVHRYCIPVE
jgi:hypothetical protein